MQGIHEALRKDRPPNGGVRVVNRQGAADGEANFGNQRCLVASLKFMKMDKWGVFAMKSPEKLGNLTI